MHEFDFVNRWLSRFSIAWSVGFVISLIAIFGARMLFGMAAPVAADAVLPLAMAALIIAAVISTAFIGLSRVNLTVKAIALGLDAVLFVPLLWAPVLAGALASQASGDAIESSNAYVQFHDVVGGVMVPVSNFVLGGGMAGTVWALSQGVATMVGFFAVLMLAWPLLVRTVPQD